MTYLKRILAIVALPLLVFGSPAKAGVIELALLVDASGSMSAPEFQEQLDAYKNIFGSATFYDDYVVGGQDLYVNMILFAAGVQETIAWTLINDNTSANAFSALVNGVTRASMNTNGTWTGTALEFALDSVLGNSINSDRAVIDMSTDGQPYRASSSGGNTSSETNLSYATANLAAAENVVLNAIGIGGGINTTFLNNVTAASGGFFVTATDFGAFEAGLADKLYTEIQSAPVPEPAALLLMGLGLLTVRRYSRKAA